MIYVMLKTSLAWEYAKSIYNLSRPPSKRDPNDVSLYFGGGVFDRGDGYSVLVIPNDASMPVDVAADDKLIKQKMEEMITDGKMSESEKKSVESKIGLKKGQILDVKTLFPASWDAQIYTRQQAIDAGFLPADEQAI